MMPERRHGPGIGPALLLVAMLAACGGEAPPVAEQANEPPPPVQARAAVDRAVATTGDLITYTVTVDYDPSYEVQVPEAGADIAGFRIVDIGHEERQADGRVIEERWYQLRADLVGSYVLPPLKVTYRATGDEKSPAPEEGQVPKEGAAEELSVVTSPIFVEVESVLPSTGEASDIRDIKPLQPKTSRVPWLWITVAVVVVLALVVGTVLFLRRKRKPQPAVPPHEVAFAALDTLRGTDFDDPEAVRRFYFAISEVVRAYVEGRFALNATDLTSEEICARLSGVTGLEQEPESQLRRFLADTDQVKFAAHQPASEEIHETYEGALTFVETTRPRDDAAGDAAAAGDGSGATGESEETTMESAA